MTGRFAPGEWLDCFGAALLAMTGVRSLGVEGGSETLPYFRSVAGDGFVEVEEEVGDHRPGGDFRGAGRGLWL